MHVSDWYPTLVEGVAGGLLNGTKPLDGYNQWDSLTGSEPTSPRVDLLHNIDILYKPKGVAVISSFLVHLCHRDMQSVSLGRIFLDKCAGGRNSSVGSAWARCPQRRGFDPPLGIFSVRGDFFPWS